MTLARKVQNCLRSKLIAHKKTFVFFGTTFLFLIFTQTFYATQSFPKIAKNLRRVKTSWAAHLFWLRFLNFFLLLHFDYQIFFHLYILRQFHLSLKMEE